jgi:beta-N-acetylhexosaminidase
VRRRAAAALAAALALAPGPAAAAVAPPPIVAKPVPFGVDRKAETAAYMQRHYGLGGWRLVRPRVVVQHVTASSSFASAWSTFAANAPDGELGERPGVCAHFVVDTDGTVYRLVPTGAVCRHTVGLNWTAIGVEHVGTTAAAVLANPRQLRASLRLTLWLAERHGIGLRDVIGHNESLRSRFHRERYAGWRCQTHGDWAPAEAAAYRRELRALARRLGVELGAGTAPRASRC